MIFIQEGDVVTYDGKFYTVLSKDAINNTLTLYDGSLDDGKFNKNYVIYHVNANKVIVEKHAKDFPRKHIQLWRKVWSDDGKNTYCEDEADTVPGPVGASFNPYVVETMLNEETDNVLQVSATRQTDEGKWKFTSFDQGQYREAGALRLINAHQE